MLPWAAGPLTLLEGIAKVPDRQVTKTGKSSIFLLSFLCHDSTITTEAITTIKTQTSNTNHWVLHSLLIVIIELELFFSDSQALQCERSVLYAILLVIILFVSAICYFVSNNIIHSMYPSVNDNTIKKATETSHKKFSKENKRM